MKKMKKNTSNVKLISTLIKLIDRCIFIASFNNPAFKKKSSMFASSESIIIDGLWLRFQL